MARLISTSECVESVFFLREYNRLHEAQVEGGFCPMPALEDPAPKGNFYLQNELHNFTWVVVLRDGSSKVGASRSASFQLPECLHEGLLQVCPCPTAKLRRFAVPDPKPTLNPYLYRIGLRAIFNVIVLLGKRARRSRLRSVHKNG